MRVRGKPKKKRNGGDLASGMEAGMGDPGIYVGLTSTITVVPSHDLHQVLITHGPRCDHFPRMRRASWMGRWDEEGITHPHHRSRFLSGPSGRVGILVVAI